MTNQLEQMSRKKVRAHIPHPNCHIIRFPQLEGKDRGKINKVL